MKTMKGIGAFHYAGDLEQLTGPQSFVKLKPGVARFTYDFQNFFHPWVAELIQKLNQTSVAGMLDPKFLSTLNETFFANEYQLSQSGGFLSTIVVKSNSKVIDVSAGGPYANYNWELLYHIPVMIAVHLSNNQRFAEAQNWFHLVFDPTSTDVNTPTPQRYWKFLAFRGANPAQSIQTLLQLLSTPDAQLSATDLQTKQAVLTGYDAMLKDPFNPHAIARTRLTAYQWYVVMKYLDNLIAWGDSLFMQDTIETLNEATLCYVLAADILGPKPQALPARGAVARRTFAQLNAAGLDPMSNALVSLESQFPFNTVSPPSQGGGQGSGSGAGSGDQSGALFGIGRSLYFCIPPNTTLLGYWDTVADRLFKIRNSENIQGVAQQLPLFDPPLDPGMLVQAAAAGIDIGTIVSGLNQPLGPVRSMVLIQKSLELASEVRSLGGELLAALQKGDEEQLSLLRQGHEVQLQQMSQNVRFLQWQHAEESTNGLLKVRDSAFERYTFYLRALGLTPDPATSPPTLPLDRRKLTETNFADAYNALVAAYDLPVARQAYSALKIVGSSSPSIQAGATGQGNLFLNAQEDAELNQHLPSARDFRAGSSTANVLASSLTPIPSAEAHLAFWGIGVHSKITSGEMLGALAKIAATLLQITAESHTDQAGIAARTASYQRRVDDWMLQANTAARELMQIGRQILASLIAEQIAYHDYQVAKTQVAQAQEVHSFLATKFTNVPFYGWMQSEISSLYYQYYRFACDTARKAEQTMKRELMRPELDQTTFIQFNYWDKGHHGLLSGEALYFDVKRMELAFHDSNKRELELTRSISLRQLDPLALLTLKITGSCTVTIPEWLYDLDCPGLYMRRIKSFAASLPAVVGPYTNVNCTLSLLRSTVRVSSDLLNGAYGRDLKNADARFIDYFGGADVIVTSSANNDSGMFTTDLNDSRFLPFEGAGAVSTWTLSLPAKLRAFDYLTISDVILHVRYTARPAGDRLGSQATTELQAMLATQGQSAQVLSFCLRYDFPTQWAAFVNDPSGTASFTVTLTPDHFPYMAKSAKSLVIDSFALYAPDPAKPGKVLPDSPQPTQQINATPLPFTFSTATPTATLTLPADAVMVRVQSQQVFLLLQYHFAT